MVAPFEKSKLVRLGDRSGELLYGMARVESSGIRDLEWKELVVWGCPRVWVLSELSGFEKAVLVEDGGAEAE